MIDISKSHHKFLKKLLVQFTDQELITEEQTEKMLSQLHPIPFDWKRFAKNMIRIAIVCVLMAFLLALSSDWLIAIIKYFIGVADFGKALLCFVVASLFYGFGVFRLRSKPKCIYTNEGVMFLGVVANAGFFYWLGLGLNLTPGGFSHLILASSVCYGLIAFYARSSVIWAFAILTLGAWVGAETGYVSGWGAYYFGLNYPVRFVLIGLLLVVISWVFPRIKALSSFYPVTRIVGLLYLFTALWILSIFGNYGDMQEWHEVRQYELLHWSLLFGAASVVSIFLGCKWDDAAYRGFGLTFLFINLYTRYFEVFWSHFDMAIFMLFLGLSFWLIGAKAEKIWLMSESVFRQKKAKAVL
ncbi:MAG: hypothetical protein MRY21_00390 [Simkaniaceae bacterium]|nr:hypothetical protein [Simkaniaceae bacterium]